jgi:hypothetical protein
MRAQFMREFKGRAPGKRRDGLGRFVQDLINHSGSHLLRESIPAVLKLLSQDRGIACIDRIPPARAP